MERYIPYIVQVWSNNEWIAHSINDSYDKMITEAQFLRHCHKKYRIIYDGRIIFESAEAELDRVIKAMNIGD